MSWSRRIAPIGLTVTRHLFESGVDVNAVLRHCHSDRHNDYSYFQNGHVACRQNQGLYLRGRLKVGRVKLYKDRL